MRRLTTRLNAQITYYDLDRTLPRQTTSRELWKLLKSSKWDLVYQEGTGIAGGANLIRAAIAHKQSFIVSSGDPIGGYFQVTKGNLAGQVFTAYEKLLYRTCTAFVGWTPYLTGAALNLGAKRAITIEGAVDLNIFSQQSHAEQLTTRARYHIPAEHLVCGVVGSLNWNAQQSYCYGLELIESLKRLKRTDVSMLIVGDGDGKSKLEAAIPEALRSRVIFTGRLSESEVVSVMNGMDIGFVTQTLDQLGSYRLTTKLPEYLACGLPIAMSPIPGFYDYVIPAGWALPPYHPASPEFHQHCADWLDRLTRDEVKERSSYAINIARRSFDYGKLSAKFCNFVHELLERSDSSLSIEKDHAASHKSIQTVY
jgi:Glycosyl transferases group 1